MLTRISDFVTPPVFPDDEDKTRAASLLNILLSGLMLVLGAATLAVPVLFVQKLYSLVFVLAFLSVMVAARFLMRRGHVRLASAVFVFIAWVAATIFLSLAGGMTSIAATFYLALTVIAGLLLGARGFD